MGNEQCFPKYKEPQYYFRECVRKPNHLIWVKGIKVTLRNLHAESFAGHFATWLEL